MVTQNECPSVTACAVDAGCQAAVRCRFSSVTLDVQESCPALGPQVGVNPVAVAQSAPIASSCSSACSWGADWSCVGRVHWPAASVEPLTVIAFVYGGTTPLAGATVTACSLGDPTCTHPLATPGTTDDAGLVTLELGSEPGPTPISWR